MKPAGWNRPSESGGDGLGPPGTPEWVLPLVIRLERADPPARTDALEAAARAVLTMLTTVDPDWQVAIRAWDGSRIRKVVRRARGTEWRRASAVPGISLTHRSAEIRVHPPVPLDGWPPELARLQVGGTELNDLRVPGPPPSGVPLVLVSPHVEMSAGKAMAQVGHAAQLGWRACSEAGQQRWREIGFACAVRVATAATWAAATR